MKTRSVFTPVLFSVPVLLTVINVFAANPPTPKCDRKEFQYLYPGQWEGKFEMGFGMARNLGGMDYSMSTRFFGKQRFLIMPEGNFGPFIGSVESEGRQKIGFPGNEITGGAADNRTVGKASLEVDPQSLPTRFPPYPLMINRYLLKGQMTQTLQLTINTHDGPERRQKTFGGPVEFVLLVEQASCDVVKGRIDSDSVRRRIKGMLDEGFTVVQPPGGQWEVRADPEKTRKLNHYRERLNKVLNVPLVQSDKAMDEAGEIWREIWNNSFELRECFQAEWMDRVTQAIRGWVNELLTKLQAAHEAKASYCAVYPVMQDVLRLARHNDLLGCPQAGFDGVNEKIVSIMLSQSARMARGEPPRVVLGLPCPALETDPAKRAAMEKYLQAIRGKQ